MVPLKPEIGKMELLLKMMLVWLISELAYHGVEKLILHNVPMLEFVRILLVSTGAMIVVSGWVAMNTFSKMKTTQNSQ